MTFVKVQNKHMSEIYEATSRNIKLVKRGQEILIYMINEIKNTENKLTMLDLEVGNVL